MSEEPAVSSLSGSCTAARASVGSMSSSTSVALPTPPTNSWRPCTPGETCQVPHFCTATIMAGCLLHQYVHCCFESFQRQFLIMVWPNPDPDGTQCAQQDEGFTCCQMFKLTTAPLGVSRNRQSNTAYMWHAWLCSHLDRDDSLLVIVIEADAQVLRLPQLIVHAVKEYVLLCVFHLVKQRHTTASGTSAASEVTMAIGKMKREADAAMTDPSWVGSHLGWVEGSCDGGMGNLVGQTELDLHLRSQRRCEPIPRLSCGLELHHRRESGGSDESPPSLLAIQPDALCNRRLPFVALLQVARRVVSIGKRGCVQYQDLQGAGGCSESHQHTSGL